MTSEPVLVAVAGGTIINGYGEHALVQVTEIDTWLSPAIHRPVRIQWITDIPSPAFDLVDIIQLASKLVQSAKELGTTKVVVLTGTDAMEEVAFALDLLLPPELTVVCTGAMQSPEATEFDGVMNLNTALAFLDHVGDTDGRSFVALGRVVLGAFGATKVESRSFNSSVASFADPWKGPAAEVNEKLEVSSRHLGYRRGDRLEVTLEQSAPTVPIISAGLGETGDWIGMLSRDDIDGLVISAMGSGNTHPTFLANLEPFLEHGKPLIVSSRCFIGSSQSIYEYPGGGAHWESLGAIMSGALSPQKARILVVLAVWASRRQPESAMSSIRAWLKRHDALGA